MCATDFFEDFLYGMLISYSFLKNADALKNKNTFV